MTLNHVLLYKRDTKIYQVIFLTVTIKILYGVFYKKKFARHSPIGCSVQISKNITSKEFFCITLYYTMPCAIMVFATLRKPATLAPRT